MATTALKLAGALSPLVVVLGAMLWRGWPALKAGSLSLLVALAVAVGLFGWGSLSDGFGLFAESAFLSGTIVWILLPALALHHLQERTGAHRSLQDGLFELAGSPARQVVLVGWFFALFFEGAAGFGTPVALAAPLLVALGLEPVRALATALVGHALGVAFGALGTPLLTLASLTGLPSADLAWRTGVLLAALGPVMLLGWRWVCTPALRPPPGLSLAALMAFLIPCLALATWVGPELATLGGALVGLAAFLAIAPGHRPRLTDRRALVSALAPFLVLAGLVVVTRGWAPLTSTLDAVRLEWTWPQSPYRGSMSPLLHPGTLLFVALVVGAWLAGARRSDVTDALATAARRLVPVTGAMLVMLALSRLMLHAGLLETLEGAAVASVGSAWPLLAPTVGAVGSFVTGSATASNVLFGALQAETAKALGISSEWVSAAQNLGAALGNVVSPQNVIAGAVTVGASGREGEVLRLTAVVCAVTLITAGLVVALAVHLSA